MACRRLRLQLLELAAAASLLLLLLPAVPATPPSTNAASAAAVVRHAAPRSVDVVTIHGPRRLVSDDVPPVYAEADAPAASSSNDGDPAAARSPSGDDGDSTVLKFLWRAFGPVIFFLVAFFVVGAVAVLVFLLLKFSGFAAAYVVDRCASAWHWVKEARKKAARVRPVDEDAAGA